MNDLITVNRDCDATMIPSGEKVTLNKGTHVRITQALGGDFTLYVNGNLLKISGKDADAIGKENEVSQAQELKDGMKLNENMIWDVLKTCYDPEIPVNIVELGLIYDLRISKKGDEEKLVNIKMTLTAPGCGMGPSIAADVEMKILNLPEVGEVFVEIVWEPQWEQSMMTDEAKLQLGML
jgi:probable FeS assembly SUF system protein SufT